jgi:hypothetical protein
MSRSRRRSLISSKAEAILATESIVDMRSFVGVVLVAAGLSMTAAIAPAVAQSDVEAFSRLPSQEVAAAQIGWFVNNTQAAFVDAIEKQRPLILVLGDSTSNLTLAFAQYVASCPHLNQLAGAATFAYGSPASEEDARRVAVHLQLTDYPTITVLAPQTDILRELYRMEGFFDAAAAAADLYKVLVRDNYWPADRPPPEALPASDLAYPNMACTHEGARKLGIVPQ